VCKCYIAAYGTGSLVTENHLKISHFTAAWELRENFPYPLFVCVRLCELSYLKTLVYAIHDISIHYTLLADACYSSWRKNYLLYIVLQTRCFFLRCLPYVLRFALINWHVECILDFIPRRLVTSCYFFIENF
jgi:hypothetical protein